ncbi:MAG TPA: HAMP domain-containing sensor histidine kinase [Candidatus Dormibacteraeota bacterium]|nr:HAMP domain-containing sensor histidine kinase [Candidatus Dormibacteraeota bacterium]
MATTAGGDRPTPPLVEWLADLSHELRGPLTVVRGAATLLLDSGEALTDQRRAEMLQMIDRQAETMSERLDDLVTLASIESGVLVTHPGRVELADLLSDLLDWLGRRQELRKLEVSAAARELAVWADREYLHQILRCLLDNALRRTPSDGQIRITAALDGQQGILTVADSGPLRPESVKAFEPARRGPRLHLARELVRAMGGDLVLASGSDGLTAFSVTLPIDG